MGKKRGARQSKRAGQREAGQPSPALALDTAPPATQSPPTQSPLVSGRIYTQCPLCKTVYRISVAQLRQASGEAYCLECQAGFNALHTLAETAERTGSPPLPSRQPPRLGRMEEATNAASNRDANKAPASLGTTPADMPPVRPNRQEPNRATPGARWAWGVGSAGMIALLALQLIGFKGPELAQNERLRPWLENACEGLGCRLPPFRAPDRIQIIDHALHPTADGSGGYEFILTLSNQASIPQAFPVIKLSLEAFNGSPAGERAFQPEEYLPTSSPTLMPVGELREIRLLLAKPNREIGGFSFELF